MTGSSPEATAPTETIPVDPQISDVSATVDSSNTETQGDKSLLESVQAALKEGATEASPGSGPEPEASGSPKAAVADPVTDEPLGDLTPEELSKYAPKTQRRMQHLLQQRHEFESRATAAEEKATRFDQIVGYTEANRLSNDDVAAIFEIGALVKNDPEKAYDKLLPVFLHVSKLTGRVLPPDVEERVNLGYLPKQDAQELVRLQTRTALNEQRLADQAKQSQEAQERNLAETRDREIQSTAVAWEEQRTKTDPDWSSKKDLVLSVMQADAAQKGYPSNKAETIALLNGALEKVDAQLARFRPQPKAITPVLGTSSASATAEPKSALEAARMAVGGAR